MDNRTGSEHRAYRSWNKGDNQLFVKIGTTELMESHNIGSLTEINDLARRFFFWSSDAEEKIALC
jgi:hypothetical protein